jgi:ABC-2 type transport system ATP-binding protein
MRQLGVLAHVLLVAAWQVHALGQVSPPAQAFGPDTYRSARECTGSATGVCTGEGTTQPGLSCSGSASAGRLCSGFLPSGFDGALLDVIVNVPPGSGPHPLVAVLHGWGGNKNGLGYIADPLLADGHAVLRYSARGFGESWGQVNLADVHVEMEDLRSMIGQVVDRSELGLNPDAIGIIGVSYGGGQTWLSLVRPAFKSPKGAAVRIRTAVPIVPWSDLAYSLVPNGRPEWSIEPAGSSKLSLINGLYVSGLRRSAQRPYPNYPDYLIAWHAWLNAMEPNRVDPVYRQIIDGVAGYRSVWWQLDFWREVARNRVPVFQVQGLTDDLFPLPEAKRMLLALKAVDPGYPIASYFGDIGHPRASNKTAERDYMLGLIRDWFRHYLRGIGPIPDHVIRAAITRARSQPFDPNSDIITATSYDALATRTIGKSFDGRATLVNPLSDPLSGFCWDPLFMEAWSDTKVCPAPPDPAVVPGSLGVFKVGVAELTGGAPLVLAGQAAVGLRAATLAPRVQLNVRLVDVAPGGTRSLITRGTYMLEQSGTADVTIQTYGNVWQAAPDHVLQLEITNVDSPYLAPSRVPSVTQISRVRLDVPVR